MSRLGHATPTMALRYQHATTERDAAIADRLGVLMRAVDQADPAPKVASIGPTA
jgi:hypothetical protein